MVNEVTLGAALRSTITSISRTEKTIDVITERLASGKDVNSAVDDPQNFFTARALSNEASDNARLLDGIGQSIRTVQEAVIGLEAIEKLINQGKSIVTESQQKLILGEQDDAVFQKIINVAPQPLSTQIAALNPDVYFRLNETGGPIIDSGVGVGGPVGATRLGGASPGAAPLYGNGSAPSVNFDGANDRIQVDDSTLINTAITPERTVELVFNADDVSGRQVLYEEGAGVNGLTIYIDNGSIYFTAEDDQGANRFADIDINAPIVAGQTYHAAFVFNGASGPADGGAGANTFAGYLNGVQVGSETLAGDNFFPSHSGNIGIGAAVDGVQFHDGESGAGFRFDGRISDVAIHNNALSQSILQRHADSLEASTTIQNQNRDFNAVLDQITQIAIDANYRGINLLLGDDLLTDFNRTRTSTLLTEGEDFSAEAFGLQRSDFTELASLELMLNQLADAKQRVREFAFTLSNDLSIIQIRNTFVRENIINLEAGSDDLTLADINEEGAEFLAAQTRQAIGITALNFAVRQPGVADILGA